MNFYKFIKALKSIIDEQEELLEIGEVQLMNGFSGRGWYKDVITSKNILRVLQPIRKELDFSLTKKILEEDVYPNSYMPLDNNRVCIFEGESGKIYSAFYSDRAASCSNITNDHQSLYDYLDRKAWDEEDAWLKTSKRWCGFYSFICNNRNTILILHGMSDTFPHNEDSPEVLKRAVENNFGMDKWSIPDKIILIDTSYNTHLLK